MYVSKTYTETYTEKTGTFDRSDYRRYEARRWTGRHTVSPVCAPVAKPRGRKSSSLPLSGAGQCATGNPAGRSRNPDPGEGARRRHEEAVGARPRKRSSTWKAAKLLP